MIDILIFTLNETGSIILGPLVALLAILIGTRKIPDSIISQKIINASKLYKNWHKAFDMVQKNTDLYTEWKIHGRDCDDIFCDIDEGVCNERTDLFNRVTNILWDNDVFIMVFSKNRKVYKKLCNFQKEFKKYMFAQMVDEPYKYNGVNSLYNGGEEIEIYKNNFSNIKWILEFNEIMLVLNDDIQKNGLLKNIITFLKKDRKLINKDLIITKRKI